MNQPYRRRRRRGVVVTEAGLEKLRNGRLELERQMRGGDPYSLDDLEERTGLATRTIARILDGREPVDRRSIMQLATALSAELTYTDIVADAPHSESAESTEENASPRHNLPSQLTELLGRERERSEIGAVLGIARLVTLTGPSGVGKTRLATQIGFDVLETFKAGAWFAEFGELADPALVESTVVTLLGLPDSGETRAARSVTSFLATRTALLIFDNCEHVLSAAAHLAELILRACPFVRILATGHEALHVRGERIFRIMPLETPSTTTPLRAADCHRYAAVELFVQRAAAADAYFKLDDPSISAAADICRRLEGIPLAIELAAALTRAISVDQLASAIDKRFDILDAGARLGRPGRQTLRAMMDWSYRLLSVDGMAMVRRLAVFSGGWTFEAAAALASADGLASVETLRLLGELVDKSFILCEPHEEARRFRMLETTREYARDRAGPRESAALQARHLDFFRRFADDASTAYAQLPLDVWLDEIESEYENCRAALQWSLAERHAVTEGVALASSLARYWFESERWREGDAWIDLALDQHLARIPPAQAAQLFFGRALMAGTRADTARERKALERALRFFDDAGDAFGCGDVLAQPALVQAYARDRDGLRRLIAPLATLRPLQRALSSHVTVAEAMLAESLRLGEATANQRGVGAAVAGLALLAVENSDDEGAIALFDRSLAIFRRRNDHRNVAVVLAGLAEVAARMLDFEQAIALSNEAAETYQFARERGFAVEHLCRAGFFDAARGNVEAARARFRDALAGAPLGDARGIRYCLEGISELAVQAGDAQSAARLFAFATTLPERVAIAGSSSDGARRARVSAQIENALSVAAFRRAWNQGLHLTRDEAIAEALRIT